MTPSGEPSHPTREEAIAAEPPSSVPDPARRFAAPAAHYDRFMGRYTETLAAALADMAGVTAEERVLDVGCGPGGLTSELCQRVGAENVAAIDPAPQFVSACRERHPGADVREGMAEALPWPDGYFDVSVSSLVIGFMSDPDLGAREMARVTRPGGTVAGVHVGHRVGWDDHAPDLLDLRAGDRAGRRGRAPTRRDPRG